MAYIAGIELVFRMIWFNLIIYLIKGIVHIIILDTVNNIILNIKMNILLQVGSVPFHLTPVPSTIHVMVSGPIRSQPGLQLYVHSSPRNVSGVGVQLPSAIANGVLQFISI